MSRRGLAAKSPTASAPGCCAPRGHAHSFTQGQVTLTSYERILGNKRFELSNHLGNVLAVVTDMKLGSQAKKQVIMEEFEYTVNSTTADKRPSLTGNPSLGSASECLFTPSTSTYTPKNMHPQCFGQQIIREMKPGDLVKVNLWVKNPSNALGAYVVIDFHNENGAYILDNTSGNGLWYPRELQGVTSWTQWNFPISSTSSSPMPELTEYPTIGNGVWYIKLPTSGITNPGGGTRYYARVSVWNANLTASNVVYVDEMEVTVVHDPQLNQGSSALTELDHYTANVESSMDYYAFGQLMPDRSYTPDAYRYGFNGHAKDDEVTDVTGASYDTHYRGYDSRLGRWFSMDPITFSYESPYAGISNSPITFTDPLGDRIKYGGIKNRLNIMWLRLNDREFNKWWKETVKPKYGGRNSAEDLTINGTHGDRPDLKHAGISEKRPNDDKETTTNNKHGKDQDYLWYNGTLDVGTVQVNKIHEENAERLYEGSGNHPFSFSFNSGMSRTEFDKWEIKTVSNIGGSIINSTNSSLTQPMLTFQGTFKVNPIKTIDGAIHPGWGILSLQARAMSFPEYYRVVVTRQHGWNYRYGQRISNPSGPIRKFYQINE